MKEIIVTTGDIKETINSFNEEFYELLDEQANNNLPIEDKVTHKTLKNIRAQYNADIKALDNEVKKITKTTTQKIKDSANEQLKDFIANGEKIDKKIKTFEAELRLMKECDCIELFDSKDKPDFLKYSQVFKETWYNETYSLTTIEREIDSVIEKVKDDLMLLSNNEDIEEYKKTLDVIPILRKNVKEEQRVSLHMTITVENKVRYNELIEFLENKKFEYEMEE